MTGTTRQTTDALQQLAAVQRSAWGEHTASFDLAGILIARASDAMHVALRRQPNPASPIETMRIDVEPDRVAAGFEPAILQAIQYLNQAYVCLFVTASDALSTCMEAVAEERRQLERRNAEGA